MRSIRVSLLTYFLLFLAIVLGLVSWYAYAMMEDAVLARETSERGRLESEYERQCREFRDSFDEEVLRSAHRFASLASAQWPAPSTSFAGLSSASMALSPFIPNSLPVWHPLEMDAVVNRAQMRSGQQVKLLALEDLMTNRPTRIRNPDRHCEPEFFQLFSDRGVTVQRSRSLEDHVFQLDPRVQRRPQMFDPDWDDHEIKPGLRVRRVTMKVPVTKTRWTPPPARNAPVSEDRPERPERAGGGARRPTFEFATPSFFIQFARSTEERDANLTAFTRQRDRHIANLQDDSQATLAMLRTRLLTISLATFGFTLLGGLWLIHRVLRPVGRLTQAVSQVSELDFKLRLKRHEVPEELVPIVDKLQTALQSLEKAFEREKQAAADISHELRTPISSLLATIQVCLRKPRSSEEYRTALQTCNDIGQQLSGLVERLLTLARIDAGADKLRPEVVDVPELAEQCVTMIRPLAEARELSLKLNRNGPIVIETDPDKLREIVTNLLHNAIQYNRPHGTVNLSVARENGHVQLEVRDTGIGISPAARTRLFERFYRADPSRHSDTVHAGLGLAIIKGYLDLMGGRIEVESEEGKGSTFRVLLPAQDDTGLRP